jgi:cytoskeleton protein RodZ
MSNKELENLPTIEELNSSVEESLSVDSAVAVVYAKSLLATLPGPVLAAKREELRWSVEEAAERLKLTSRQVVALEANDFDALPGMSSVRGFVRSYAKLMGLDPEPLLEMMVNEPNPAHGHMLLRRPLPRNGFPGRPPSSSSRRAAWTKKIALLFVVAVCLAILVYQGYRPSWLSTALFDDLLPELTWPSVLSSAVLEEQQLEKKISLVVSETISGPPVPVADPLKSLEVVVVQDAWVEITTTSGTKLVSRLMKAGSKELFEINEPVVLIIGNVSGVQAKLRGQVLNLKAVAHDNVSKLNLK